MTQQELAEKVGVTRQTIIANGTVIHADRQEKADVLLEGERIAAIGKGLAESAPPDAEVIDAAGKYVIPGVLDVHVHLELPFCGTVSSDDWNTGTKAAARGGVTTVIDFAIPYGQESLQDAFENWSARAKKSCIDYCFHMAITNWDRHGPEMEIMVRKGCPTFKEFMIYASEGWQSDDRAIFNALEQCKRLGGMLLIHAESARVLDELIARHPELVRETIRRALPANPASLSVAIRAGRGTFTEAGGPQAYFGDPAAATAEEGRRTVEELGAILTEAVLAGLSPRAS